MERPDLVRELGLVARAEFEEALDAKKRIFAYITHLEAQLQTAGDFLENIAGMGYVEIDVPRQLAQNALKELGET